MLILDGSSEQLLHFLLGKLRKKSSLYYRQFHCIYFLFLRSMLLLLISFFARADPEGIPYCIGEGACAGGAVIGIVAAVTGGAGGRGGAAAAGVSTVSGRGLGKMCFNLLFLWFFQKKNCCLCANSFRFQDKQMILFYIKNKHNCININFKMSFNKQYENNFNLTQPISFMLFTNKKDDKLKQKTLMRSQLYCQLILGYPRNCNQHTLLSNKYIPSNKKLDEQSHTMAKIHQYS